MKKKYFELLKSITKKQLTIDANQTTSLSAFQKKAPKELKKFKK